MASKVRHDICVKVGSYRDRDGNEKAKYQKVGVELEMDQGGRVILLERWFNPAGVPDPEGRGTVLLSLFDPREEGQGGARGASDGNGQGWGAPRAPAASHEPRGGGQRELPGANPTQSRGQASPSGDGFTDDIPF